MYILKYFAVGALVLFLAVKWFLKHCQYLGMIAYCVEKGVNLEPEEIKSATVYATENLLKDLFKVKNDH